jgi:hypothetical protein
MEQIAKKRKITLQHPFKVKYFSTQTKLANASLFDELIKYVLYLACEIRLKDKTYGLSFLITP